MIPIVPVLVIVPLSIAGMPGDYLALLPVPMMCVFLGWTMHNDVAYDNTAIWLHVASGTRGVSDRIGRLVPALFAGIILIGLGSPVSVYFHGDWSALPSMLGVSTSILLTGFGFSSYTSARFPYPATKPGDSPFAQPQASDTASALIQSMTFLGSIILSLPAIILALMGMFIDPVWHLSALYAGVGIGILTTFAGIWLGSRTYERRGPEILASALRA
jgi:ABC-2 type transport system permease protein